MAAKGTIICFFSPKGGVGRTCLSVNLAAALAAAGHRTVLADFDLQSGVAEQLLGLTPAKGVAEMIHDSGFTKPDNYTTYAAENFDLLAAPLRPEQGLTMDDHAARSLLQALRADFDFVVVDTPAFFADHVSAAVEAADFIGLVVTNNVLALKSAAFALQNLAILGYELQTMRLIVNDIDARGVLTADVESALGMQAFWQIRHDKNMQDSLSKAVPLFYFQPRCHFSVEIGKLALAIAIEFGKTRRR